MNRILITFCSDFSLMDVKSILDRSDCENLTVTNGADALYQLKKFKPNLIFVGQRLPDMKVTELCRQIKETPGFGDIPIIGITGPDGEGERNQTGCKDCEDLLDTPIDKVELFKTIKKYISIIERQFPRAPICKPVKYYYKKLEYQGLLFVVGEGGAFIIGEHALPAKTPIRMKFHISAKESEPIEVEAEVKWNFSGEKVCPQLLFKANSMGLRFTKIRQEDKKTIVGYVNKYLRIYEK